jgi:hypothetical protein
MSPKTSFFTVTAVKTSNLALCIFLFTSLRTTLCKYILLDATSVSTWRIELIMKELSTAAFVPSF